MRKGPEEMLSLAELEPICQKPGHRFHGNWMARRIARPVALRVTRLVLPLGIGAHFVTVVAMLVGLMAAVALAHGSRAGLIGGAVLLQLWYLLDHVDGQVARYRGTASLSGVYLDYLMHYVVHAACPFGLGWGLFVRTAEPLWFLAGALWSMGTILQGLATDCRLKAFFQRLKWLEGEHRVQGGGGGRPGPAARPPSLRHPLRLVAYLAQKLGEMHVVMNLLGLLAIVSLIYPLVAWRSLTCLVGLLALLAPAVAIMRIARAVSQDLPEREFDLWFPEARIGAEGLPHFRVDSTQDVSQLR